MFNALRAFSVCVTVVLTVAVAAATAVVVAAAKMDFDKPFSVSKSA